MKASKFLIFKVFKVVWLKNKYKKSLSKNNNENKKAENGTILTFKLLFALKLNLHVGPFCRKISKFGDFNN